MPSLILVAIAASAVHPGCPKTYTYHMDTRAAWAVYAGTRDVPSHDVRMLRRIARCQRRHHNVRRSRAFNRARRAEWVERRADATMPSALASWYNLEGTGACGYGTVQGGYRFASLILACGTRVRMCRGSSCVVGVMSDRGPYVSGRTFDLNVNMRDALGCAGVCLIRWRLL